MEELAILRKKIGERNLEEKLGKYLGRIETQYKEVLDRLLTASGAGLALSVVLHEVEKGIKELDRGLNRNLPWIIYRSLPII
ncbi:MAG: hypothetical protein K8T10_15560 [Candidatus Eremiobacteraeota bacterium]|nr:hypothetical protein [Candidatus Eremiobacteraeota bacterium]